MNLVGHFAECSPHEALNLVGHFALSGKTPIAVLNSMSKLWITYSSATDHMMGNSYDFLNYDPCSGKDKDKVVDGSFVPIHGQVFIVIKFILISYQLVELQKHKIVQ